MVDWQTFKSRYQVIFREIRHQYTRFWEQLHDLAETDERRWYTTQDDIQPLVYNPGARIREFRETREQETQTLPAPGCHTGSQTDPAPALITDASLLELPRSLRTNRRWELRINPTATQSGRVGLISPLPRGPSPPPVDQTGRRGVFRRGENRRRVECMRSSRRLDVLPEETPEIDSGSTV
ncbi:unnamed protein product [Lasius platythorax]|uniref:Uncharacterized protein n=1 Tax=Lasius platythorax TaxID=488582 RepID=A0AAV2NC94_9HYME